MSLCFGAVGGKEDSLIGLSANLPVALIFLEKGLEVGRKETEVAKILESSLPNNFHSTLLCK